MKKIKKAMAMVLFCVLTCCICLSFVGCGRGFRLYESEYFIYIVGNDRNTVAILGLTDRGKEQEYLVIPATIEGKEVVQIGCTTGLAVTKIKEKYGDAKYAQLRSEKLRKVFILSKVDIKGTLGSSNVLIENEPPFEAIFYISNREDSFHIPKVFFFRTSLRGDTDLKYWEQQLADPYRCKFAANVSYDYNYEASPNDGYYWIDNYEYGEGIEYIPENPLREGYTFGGWYKESECINVWDFEEDTLPEIQYDEQGIRVYQETKLYAKWIKN